MPRPHLSKLRHGCDSTSGNTDCPSSEPPPPFCTQSFGERARCQHITLDHKTNNKNVSYTKQTPPAVYTNQRCTSGASVASRGKRTCVQSSGSSQRSLYLTGHVRTVRRGSRTSKRFTCGRVQERPFRYTEQAAPTIGTTSSEALQNVSGGARECRYMYRGHGPIGATGF